MGKGRRHDFHLFKRSAMRFHPRTLTLADSGFQGLQKLHANTALPAKHSKKAPLDQADKDLNHLISSERVPVENIIRRIMVFRIMGERYRNRRKRFGLRLHLIAGFVNAELCRRSIADPRAVHAYPSIHPAIMDCPHAPPRDRIAPCYRP